MNDHKTNWGIAPQPTPPTPQPEPQPFARALEGNYHPCDYPEDAAHENGNYATKCRCGTVFIGHKRRIICKVCAETPTPTPQPEPETDTERAHAFEWLCTKCGERGMPWTHVTYEETHDGCGGACQSVPIKPEPQQSAVEWVNARIYPHGCDPSRPVVGLLSEEHALELAERCDAAESKLSAATSWWHPAMSALLDQQSDELAAAQTEAGRLREALDWLENEAPYLSHDAWSCSADMAGNRWTISMHINGPRQNIRGRTLIETINKTRAALKEGQP